MPMAVPLRAAVARGTPFDGRANGHARSPDGGAAYATPSSRAPSADS